MRLLAKSEVAKGKALDKQREVQEGLKVAKRVDALRETAAEEEASLEKFRQKTLSTLHEQIAPLAKEKDELESKVKTLREERIRLEAPVDLRKEWELVEEGKKTNAEWRDDLLGREITLTERENNVRDDKKEVEKREKEVESNEEWVRRTTLEAQTANEVAHDAQNLAEETLKRAKAQAHEQQQLFTTKAEELSIKEQGLLAREEQVATDRVDITNQKKFLADQRATLERGFAELRRKQHG